MFWVCLFTVSFAFADESLLKDESYIGGSKKAEEESFLQDAQRVGKVQKSLVEPNQGKIGRVFHRKNNGAVLGIFQVYDNIPEELKSGIFEKPNAWLSLVRFSGGSGTTQSDIWPDVMGIAVKLLDIDPSKKERNKEIKTMDWLMTNSPTAFSHDQREFIEFMETKNEPGLLGNRLVRYFVVHPKAFFRVLCSVVGPHAHNLLETYMSGHPYLLTPNRAMKFGLKLETTPIDQAEGMTVVSAEEVEDEYAVGWNPFRYLTRLVKAIGHPNYLRDDFYSVVEKGTVTLSFFVQVQDLEHPENTPLEDALANWDAEPVTLGRLIIPQQSKDEQLMAFADALGFNPANYFAHHRPVGRLGRGRVFTYRQSQRGRNAATMRTFSNIDEQVILRQIVDKFENLGNPEDLEQTAQMWIQALPQ